jgi:hypothetical protein
MPPPIKGLFMICVYADAVQRGKDETMLDVYAVAFMAWTANCLLIPFSDVPLQTDATCLVVCKE